MIHVSLTLGHLVDHAHKLGLAIETDHATLDGIPSYGYWIVNPSTGEGPWKDGNFSTSLEEVAGKLIALEVQGYSHTFPQDTQAEVEAILDAAADALGCPL